MNIQSISVKIRGDKGGYDERGLGEIEGKDRKGLQGLFFVFGAPRTITMEHMEQVGGATSPNWRRDCKPAKSYHLLLLGEIGMQRIKAKDWLPPGQVGFSLASLRVGWEDN